MNKNDIKSLRIIELEELMKKLDCKSFHGKQIFEWLHKKLVNQFDDMTNLSKDLRDKLKKDYTLINLRLIKKIESLDKNTSKYLFELHDGMVVETVLMKYKHGNSVCISTQVGCKMGCKFCASTIGGLERNLTPSEMLEQVYQVEKDINKRITNVVVMGTGEPLDNYDNLLKFIRILTNKHGLNISGRNITVSTCGLVEKIYELADEKLQITLAISLHAPNDEVRRKLMPIAKQYSVNDIMKACEYYFENTGRRITFEYSMIQDENDSEDHAKELAKKLRGLNCHVNLIPVNPIIEREYKHSLPRQIYIFKNILEKYGINVTIRREMGTDINAACGQLRKSYMDSNSN